MDAGESLIKEALMTTKVTIIMKAWHELSTKVSTVSIKARQEGNKLFSKCHHTSQEHELIWKYYSQSIATAPIASEDLAFAYGNRSAFLMHVRKFEDSIKDIDRALRITQLDCLKIKLLCRKSQCFSTLGMNGTENILEEVKYWFDKAEQKDKDLLIKTINKTINFVEQTTNLLRKEFSKIAIEDSISSDVDSEEIFQINSILKEKKFSDPFRCVSLKYNEKYGRHLIANRDIQPGEIINISKPYVTVLNLNTFYAFCGHCLKTCWASIPCDYCNWCMFCSEQCKNEAWEKYHDIECRVIPYIQFNHSSDYWKQLSLKLTIMAIKKAGSFEKLKEELKKIDNDQTKLRKGFVNEKFEENCFQSIYSLTSNVSLKTLDCHIDHAVLTLIALAKSTTFFGKSLTFCSSEDLLANENVLFIGSLILKFLKISDINAHCVMEGSSACRFANSIETCQVNRCCERGVCLATVPSFFNHSCYPTIRKCFTEDMQLVIFALQPIKKNDQLFDSYIACYFDKSYAERKKMLQEFNFQCDCPPCKEKWPTTLLLRNHSKYFEDNKNYCFENYLLQKYEALINCRDRKLFNPNVLDGLSKDIKAAKKKLSEPSYAIATLISILWSVFDHIYGIKLKVTDKCNNI